MTTLTETRRPRPTPPTPVCEDCWRPITDPANTNRLRDAKGHFTGQARHHICPPVEVHVRQSLPTTKTVRITRDDFEHPDPIPTRPVQKHFSEAGWGASGGRRSVEDAHLVGHRGHHLPHRVSGLVASYGGGQ